MNAAVENVRRAFRSKYSFDVQSTWLQACLVWLRDQFQLADFTNHYSLERIYNQWLHTDLALIGDAHCLPADLDLNAKKVQLSGKYGLQVNSILCISEPYYTQVMSIHGDQNENERIDTDITDTQQWKPPAPKRVLYLELTDGKTILRGLEYEPINGLDRESTLPGAKILVSGPVVFRRGMLLLTPKNTQLLGGYVETLLDKNASIETALSSLSKTASRLDESRQRFDRLNIKVHLSHVDDPSPDPVSETHTNRAVPHEDEADMDEFIRQAYADGMLNDTSHMAPDATDYHQPPAPDETHQPATVYPPRTSRVIDPPEELILVSDDDDSSFQRGISPPPFSYHYTADLPSPPPAPPVRSSVITVSLPYTYLSLIRHQSLPSTVAHQDHSIQGCFSSLVTNPRLIKNEFDLQAYLNDGSDCLLVRLASDLLAQRIGITVTELMNKRKLCQNDFDKQKFQSDFNERLRKFGHGMARLNAMMTIRFFADSQMPMVIAIDDS